MPHRWTYSSYRENTRYRDQQFHSCYASLMALKCVDVRCRGKGPTFLLYYSVHPSWLLITSYLFNLTEIHHASDCTPADGHSFFGCMRTSRWDTSACWEFGRTIYNVFAGFMYLLNSTDYCPTHLKHSLERHTIKGDWTWKLAIEPLLKGPKWNKN